MNAAEQATNIELASKIAAAINLFKAQFPDAKADLKPWQNDPETRELVDPDSIDIAFHLPGWSRRWQSRSILVQIRLFQEPEEDLTKAIGLEVIGFNHTGEKWRLSTVQDWEFVGEVQPSTEAIAQIKFFCRQVFELFNSKIA